jgi:ribulose-phosphate 3-epimerase
VPPAPRTIAPSILSADFGRLSAEVGAAQAAGADWLHLDVMDGHFVPNLTIGPLVVDAVRKATSLPLDVHLMITDPDRYVSRFVEAGAGWVSVHQETCPALRDTVARLHALGARAAVAINPDTPVAAVGDDVLAEIDMLLVMSVHPGFGGQSFIPGTLAKLRAAAERRRKLGARFLIEVDGGITVENVGEAAAAGADVIVAGTAIFRAPDYARAIASMRRAIDVAIGR